MADPEFREHAEEEVRVDDPDREDQECVRAIERAIREHFFTEKAVVLPLNDVVEFCSPFELLLIENPTLRVFHEEALRLLIPVSFLAERVTSKDQVEDYCKKLSLWTHLVLYHVKKFKGDKEAVHPLMNIAELKTKAQEAAAVIVSKNIEVASYEDFTNRLKSYVRSLG